MPELRFLCFNCHKELLFQDTVGRREECPHCHADTHVCKNCEFYDRASYNECREPTADPVKEKDRSNFCDQFSPGGARGQKGTSSQDLKAAAEALFKKKI